MWVYLLESIGHDGCTTAYGVYSTADRAVAVGAAMEAEHGDPNWLVTVFDVDVPDYGESLRSLGPTRNELMAAGWRGW